MNISDDIRYIGVNDHDIDLFEGQYTVPNGMAYNSYAIIDDKDRMVKVEGVWIPEDVADTFKEKDTWKAAVAKIKPLDEATKQQATMMLTMFQGAAKKAGQATTKEELQGAVMQALMPMMMMGGMGGGGLDFGGDDDDEADETDDAAE